MERKDFGSWCICKFSSLSIVLSRGGPLTDCEGTGLATSRSLRMRSRVGNWETYYQVSFSRLLFDLSIPNRRLTESCFGIQGMSITRCIESECWSITELHLLSYSMEDCYLRKWELKEIERSKLTTFLFSSLSIQLVLTTFETRVRRRRNEALAKGNALLAEGKANQARDFFVKAVDVTPAMAYQLIKVSLDDLPLTLFLEKNLTRIDFPNRHFVRKEFKWAFSSPESFCLLDPEQSWQCRSRL